MRSVIAAYADLPRWLRKPLWRVWHQFIDFCERRDVVMTLMNYGYADLEEDAAPIHLLRRDEEERYCIQLYHFTATRVEIRNKRVLEVGSGRGGGASYISRYLGPERYVGVDLSKKGIRFCNRYHNVPNLSFVRGDAANLPFDNDSFDVVVNVESSRCYANIMRFFSEVRRVMSKAGVFLLTDCRWKDDVDTLRKQLDDAGFRIVGEKNITDNVVRALEIDSRRRSELIRTRLPHVLLNALGEFAAVKGSERYERFASGQMEYWNFRLEKT